MTRKTRCPACGADRKIAPVYYPDRNPVTGRVEGTDCYLHLICPTCESRQIVNAEDFTEAAKP